MNTKRPYFIVLMFSLCIIGLATIIFMWIMFKPIQVTYRDSIDMNIGSSKTILLKIDKTGTVFTFNTVKFSYGLLQDGKPHTLPDYLSIKETGSSPLLPPSGKNQITYIEISTSSTISPGQYQLYAQVEVAGIHLGRLPIMVSIDKSGDDIVDTYNGPVYRVNANLSENGQLEPIKETTIQLKIPSVFLTYRDIIDIKAGDYKAILLNIDMTGTDLEGKRLYCTTGVLHDGKLEQLPPNIQTEEINVENNQVTPVKVITVKLSSETWGGYTLNLGIQITAEGNGVIGIIPLTLNILASNDDMFPVPGGILTYRANTEGIDSGTGPDGNPWPAVKEKTVLLPCNREK